MRMILFKVRNIISNHATSTSTSKSKIEISLPRDFLLYHLITFEKTFHAGLETVPLLLDAEPQVVHPALPLRLVRNVVVQNVAQASKGLRQSFRKLSRQFLRESDGILFAQKCRRQNFLQFAALVLKKKLTSMKFASILVRQPL